ncbi:MAG: amino acid ABC transporter permease [Actinobacteria bacterium]|nr:amino acid ABC transporter permease [Actinomycetota bacterium]
MNSYKFDWNVIDKYFPELIRGLGITLEISLVGMAIALVFGLLLAMGRLSSMRFIRTVANAITQLFRSIPLFVMLFWVYYGLSLKFHILFTEFQAGALALGITGGAYMAEVFRGGLMAVDPGQREAAMAMGISRGTTFSHVIFPQALRVVIPPSVNVYVGLLKGATIVSVIGVSDMIYVAQYVSLQTFTPFELYSVAGIIFVALTVSISGFAWMLERRLGRGRSD